MKRILTMLLVVAMAMSFIPMQNTQSVKAAKWAERYGVSEPQIKNGVTTWDCIYFGKYPQSSNGSGGFKNESIKWRILELEGNAAYLTTDKILDSQAFSGQREMTKWSITPERVWYNNEFYNTAFNTEEKQDVYESMIESFHASLYYGSGREITWDKVFSVGYFDVGLNGFGFDSDKGKASKTRYAKVTDYAASRGVKRNTSNNEKKDNGAWLLRPTETLLNPVFVDEDGKTYKNNSLITYGSLKKKFKHFGLRPAIKLDLSTTNWSYAGTVDSNNNVSESNIPNPNDVEEPQGEFVSAGELEVPLVDEGVSTWDCVYYGNYRQSLNTDGSFKYEPIKWRVLSKDGDDLFLMADKALDSRYFQPKKQTTTWDKSENRYWMNKSLLNSAFTSREQSHIKITDVNTPKNPKNGRGGGANANDKLYLLSYQEIQNRDYGFTADYDKESDTRMISFTDYSYYKKTDNKVQVSENNKAYWYLRSPGAHDQNVGIVWNNGWSDYNGTNVYHMKDAIVPVMHLDASDAKIKYAGTVSSNGEVTDKRIKVGGKVNDNIGWVLNLETGDLTISGSGAMKDYETDGEESTAPWNKYNQHIKKVIIKGNVTTIGYYSFRGCKNLNEVDMGKKVTVVATGAFENCSNLKKVYLSDKLKSVGSKAFDGCSSELIFEAVFDTYGVNYCKINNYNCNIIYEKRYGNCGENDNNNVRWELDPENETLRFIGNGKMKSWYFKDREYDKYREYIKNVVIEDGITNVGEAALYGYRPLNSVSLPNSLESIDKTAFQQSGVKSLIIPNNVKTIGDYAFHECWALSYVYFGNQVNNIADTSFERSNPGCSVLKDSYADNYCTRKGMRIIERR